MKKFSVVLILCCAATFFCSVASAAEYVVKKGDCLSMVAVKVNHSVCDLVSLSEIKDSDLIFPGQKILFVTENDLKNAKAWAEKRKKELSPSDDNYRYFERAIEDITVANVRYSINQPSGTHASFILACSNAWKNQGNE